MRINGFPGQSVEGGESCSYVCMYVREGGGSSSTARVAYVRTHTEQNEFKLLLYVRT